MHYMRTIQKASIKEYNTFGVDNRVNNLVIFDHAEEVSAYFKENTLPDKYLVIGEGSNLLFTKDFEGSLYKMENKGIAIVEEKPQAVWVKVAAGEKWDDLVQWAVDNNYGGLENLSHIPGTLGAAPVQNIGAYGVEFQDVFQSLEAVEMATGDVRKFYLQEMDFDYRYSSFKGPLKNKYIVNWVVIKLNRYPLLQLDYASLKKQAQELSGKDIPAIADIRNAVIHIRESKLPDPKQLGNAGSFFKNPIVDEATFKALQKTYPQIVYYLLDYGKYKLAAAWLIENSGLKGFVMGAASVHDQHALILINNGGAKGSQIVNLSEHIQKTVKQKFGVDLDPEVLFV
ncbi:MAG: UDP-N-acetylenolpyruvoylglucosamine reductase [Bacteroidetes bacterium 4572_77]|nr:MAG: UDP-N-acetylenolpyruvoylglucosamine reductase [Bacteroidetes bacterium 4572_77]